jgi:RNA polymerase sigma-70 factor (ECF subfamily)
VGQEVRLKLISVFGKFVYDPARTFRGWLKTIVEHAVVDYRRRCSRAGRGSGDTEAERIIQSQPARPDRIRELEAEFDLELLRRAMQNVQERVAEHNWNAFLLVGIEGLPVDEVSRRTGLHAGKIYVAKSRVQKLLGQEIDRLRTDERGCR